MHIYTSMALGSVLALLALSANAQSQQHHRGHGNAAQRAIGLSTPERTMGGLKVRLVPLDPSRTQIGITLRDKNNGPLPPTAIPLKAEYVAKNVPFTPMSLTVSDSQLVGQVPLADIPYTIRVSFVLDGTRYEQKFFIGQPTQQLNK